MILKIIGNIRSLEDANFHLYLEQYYNKENEYKEIFGTVKYFSEPTSKTCRHLIIFDNEEECNKSTKDNQYFRKLLANIYENYSRKLQDSPRKRT